MGQLVGGLGMAIGIHLLTDRHIKNATKPIRDGGNLWMYPKGNARSWIFRYRLNGRSREMGLGGYPATTLSQARRLAAAYRETLAAGRDPLDARAEQRRVEAVKLTGVLTFTQIAARYIRAHRHDWKSVKHARQWTRTLKTYARPIIGAKPVDTIDANDILKVLSGIWVTKTATAIRLRGRIEKILDFAGANKLRDGPNPARWQGGLQMMLPKMSRKSRVVHHPAMPYGEVPRFMAELNTRTCPPSSALRFLILTAARTGEVLNARWEEINFDEAVWTIPGSRMKAGLPHRVPLSNTALAILSDQQRLAGNPYLFPGHHYGKPMAPTSLLYLMRDMGYGGDRPRGPAVPHGIRSTFRDWAVEVARFHKEVAEKALAHGPDNDTEAAYARGTLFERRMELMDEWAQWCCPDPTAGATVISFQERRSAAAR